MVDIRESLSSKRVRDLRESLFETRPRLSGERLLCLAEVYAGGDQQPPVMKRARVFQKLLGQMTIFIDQNPIVGSQTRYRVGVNPYPEYSCKWMAKEQDFFCSLGKIEVSEEDRRLLKGAAAYWRDKCALSKTKELWAQKHGDRNLRDDIVHSVGVWFDSVSHPLGGRICVDYGKVLTRGLNGVRQEAEDELRKLPLHLLEVQKKRSFLNAVIITCEAVADFAGRYGSLAEEMARNEADQNRKEELERIAETCRWVPANPARTFYEAIQSFWLIHLATQIVACADGHSPGRFSQYMYPFYRQDREEKKITEEEALELLELLFIKLTELAMFNPGRHFQEAMGNLFQNVSLGGLNEKGEDATNDIDYLLIEAQKRVRLVQPTLSVLCHDKMSEEFLLKAIDLLRTGIGMPAFFNYDLNVQRLLAHGASLDEARNHSIIGCVESGFSHTCNSLMGGFFNMPKVLELALNNGRDPVSLKQIGPQTGDASAFRSYEELHHAIHKQLQHFMPLLNEFHFTGQAIVGEFLPVPFISALVDDCIRNGLDATEGGSRHSMDGTPPVGMIDMADSLAAIKKRVFEEKSVTMQELVAALAANFEGKAEVHRLLLDAPKYGNDDNYVDSIARQWYDIFYEEHQKSTDHLGRPIKATALSITTHFPFGLRTGALPSGRRAGLPLADASVSAEPGKDVSGPTALVRSATKVLDTTRYGSGQLNMKFHPVALESREGRQKLLALIKTYLDLGGHHVQFNVVSSETLRDAQLYPDKYRDLIVRVAGFSAFFIHLDPVVQNEVIKRTELKW